MKMLLVGLLFVSGVFAHDHEENFDQFKSMVSANIDQKISALQTLKSCVSSASKKEDVKACRDSHRTTLQNLKSENQGERQGIKEKRKAMKAERKAKN